MRREQVKGVISRRTYRFVLFGKDGNNGIHMTTADRQAVP